MKTCPTCQQTYSDEVGFCPRDGAHLTAQATETEAQLAAGLARRFRIVRHLGAGAMGTVYLAEQIAVGNRPVALKVLNRKLLDDPDFLLRFQNEAASTGRIHHANVVTIYESGQADDGTPYIAMEFLEGESLRQALTRRGQLPVPEVAEILQQAARGLNAAHKLGIIHRDLKPDNIFLTYSEEESSASSSADLFSRSAALGYDRPEKPQTLANRSALPRSPANVLVKLVDFGIAKLRESGAHTQTGMVLGTPAYMSFEQASGMRSDELDARSDIYSLGIVVYEMLTGRTPFHSDTPVGYLRMHMQEDPPPFRAVAPGLPVPPAVESAVMKALAKDRDERYASAPDFARELTSAAQPSPRAEAPVTIPPTRIVPPPARPPAAPEPAAPMPLSASAQAKADIICGPSRAPRAPVTMGAKQDFVAVQTPPPAPPGKIVEPPSAQPQGTKPVAAKPPELRTAPEPPSKMKFVAIAGVALIIGFVAGVWYFSQHGKFNPKDGLKYVSQHGKVNPKDGLEYVWIPPGTFMMGCSLGDSECSGDEKPAHPVTLSKGFWIGQTDVTVGAYKRFANQTGTEMPPAPSFNSGWGNEAMPVVNISWNDAQAYCKWAGGRLPTEAEWEYAARGGSAAARYGPLDEVAWYGKNSGDQAHAVGEKGANGFGLFDTLGNVWEWVNDRYDQNYYQNSPAQDPPGPTSGQERVVRGGFSSSAPGTVRVSYRAGYDPARGSNDIFGFRCGGGVFAP